jgi:hypothetical protein
MLSVWAQRMGYGGLIPFVALALAVCLAAPAARATSSQALLAYAACIASFLGAIHWGLVMRDAARQSLAALGWGVLPSLLAWVALLLGPPLGLWMMAILLWLCFAVDRVVYPRLQLQVWLPMRLRLTLVASASCGAGALGLLR